MPGRLKMVVVLIAATPGRSYSSQIRVVCAGRCGGSITLRKFYVWKVAYLDLPRVAELHGVGSGG